MCNLLLFVFSYHYFLFPCVCVCVCLCASVCPSIRPTTETWPFLITAICVYQEPLQSVEPQEQTQWQSCYSRESKKAYTCAQMWLYVYKVFLNTKENFRTKAPPPQKKKKKPPQKTCTIPSSLWQEPGHRSDCGGRFWQRIENWEQAHVWWNVADPHSSGLTEHYFGAFWSLPRKHNNFGVSSFIYLLCFSI